MTEDDEFNDDIDWGSIEMPSTPAVTPWKNKSTNRDGAPSLTECLQMAPVFSREGDIISKRMTKMYVKPLMLGMR